MGVIKEYLTKISGGRFLIDEKIEADIENLLLKKNQNQIVNVTRYVYSMQDCKYRKVRTIQTAKAFAEKVYKENEGNKEYFCFCYNVETLAGKFLFQILSTDNNLFD